MILPELIGCEVKIIEATNRYLIGISGKIADYTKNLLIIKTNKNEKRIQKSQATFLIKLNKEWIKISGNKLIKKPEEIIVI